jgi:hypothetical protein
MIVQIPVCDDLLVIETQVVCCSVDGCLIESISLEYVSKPGLNLISRKHWQDYIDCLSVNPNLFLLFRSYLIADSLRIS